jgi:hypothetical protein
MRVGQNLDLHMTTDEANRDDAPDVSLPTSTNSDVLQATAGSASGPLTSYRAVGPGRSTLVSTTIFCSRDHSTPATPTSCPVIHVVVTG